MQAETYDEPQLDSGERSRERPVELLEREITELAAHIHAATCRWLGLVAEFDRREGWAVWGCKSCAHWLSYTCALGSGAAREQVRVARRLSELPRIRAAFGRGELSYSQVRALSRVATPELEGRLLELARYSTAAQLERVPRAYRGVLARELGPDELAHGGRYLACEHDDDGALLIRGRLPAEEGALLLAALQAGRDELRGEGPASERAEPATGPAPGPAARPGPSAPTPAAPAGPGVPSSGASPSGEPPAGTEDPGPPGPSNPDTLLLMADTLLATGALQRTGGERYQVVIHIDSDALSGTDDPERPAACRLEHGQRLDPETARRLACDAGVVTVLERDGQPLSVGRKTRSLPPALRRALQSRDHGCRFPGCAQTSYLHAHHIQPWAQGGQTELANLVQLCAYHHRLLHEGGYRLIRGQDQTLTFIRPDGRPIPPTPPVTEGNPHRLHADNHRRGNRITPHTTKRTGTAPTSTSPSQSTRSSGPTPDSTTTIPPRKPPDSTPLRNQRRGGLGRGRRLGRGPPARPPRHADGPRRRTASPGLRPRRSARPHLPSALRACPAFERDAPAISHATRLRPVPLHAGDRAHGRGLAQAARSDQSGDHPRGTVSAIP
jgi:Domain of unknown function (DUF222)/HNH endonuclease